MKTELAHDIIAAKVWERLPERDKELRRIMHSLEQRLRDHKEGKGSLLGEKEIIAWHDYISLDLLNPEAREYWTKSEKKVKQDKKRAKMLLWFLGVLSGLLFIVSIGLLSKIVENKSARLEITSKDKKITEKDKKISGHQHSDRLIGIALEQKNSDRTLSYRITKNILDNDITKEAAKKLQIELFSDLSEYPFYFRKNYLKDSKDKTLFNDSKIMLTEKGDILVFSSAEKMLYAHLIDKSRGEDSLIWQKGYQKLISNLSLDQTSIKVNTLDGKLEELAWKKFDNYKPDLDILPFFTSYLLQYADNDFIDYLIRYNEYEKKIKITPKDKRDSLAKKPFTLGLNSPISAITLSPNAKSLIYGDENKTIKLMNLIGMNEDKEVKQTYNITSTVSNFRFSKNGKTLAAGCNDGSIYLYRWNKRGLTLLKSLYGHNRSILDLRFIENDTTLLSISKEGDLVWWNIGNLEIAGDFTRKISSAINSIALSEAKLALAPAKNQDIHFLYDIDKMDDPVEFKDKLKKGDRNQGNISEISFSPNGHYYGTINTNWIINIREVHGNKTKDLRKAGYIIGNPRCISLSNSMIAIGRNLPKSGDLSTVYLFKYDSTDFNIDLIANFQTNSTVNSVDISSDEQNVLVGCWDGHIYLMDTAGHFLDTLYHFDAVKSLKFSHDKKTIVSGSWDKSVRIWTVDSTKNDLKYKPEPELPEIPHYANVNGIDISPDDKYMLTVSSTRKIRIFKRTNWGSFQEITSLIEHPEGITCGRFYFDSDGTKYIITGSKKGTLKFWNIDLFEKSIDESTAKLEDEILDLNSN